MDYITVTDTAFIIPGTKTKVLNVEPGKWIKHAEGTSEIYLHERLGLEVATTLSIWETEGQIKITKNEHDKVIGIARKA